MNAWMFIWLSVIIVTLVIEISTVALSSIWLTGGGLAALLVCVFGGPWWLQVIVFFAVTFVLIYFTRPWALKYLESRKTVTNYEETIGKKVRVTETVDNRKGTGKADYKGMEWTARARDEDVVFSKGEQAKVVAVEGVKLILERSTQDEE